MKQRRHRDHYAVLGVPATATKEEIHAAYRRRALRFHPDRVNREKEPQKWQRFNELFSKLSEAYAVLRDNDSRAEFDRSRIARDNGDESTQQEAARQEAEREEAANVGDLSPGQFEFDELPASCRAMLLRRQAEDPPDQVRIKLHAPLRNVLYLALCSAWFLVPFANSDGARWSDEGRIAFYVVSAAAGLLVGENAASLLRDTRSKLGRFLYVTPLYFIKTLDDVVSIRPVWTLESCEATDHYTNRVYQQTTARLRFRKGDAEAANPAVDFVSFGSKEAYARFAAFLDTARTMAREAYAAGRFRYFEALNEFHSIPRNRDAAPRSLSTRTRYAIRGTCVAVSLLLVAIASGMNEDASRRRWVDHSGPASATPSRSPQSAPDRWGGTDDTWKRLLERSQQRLSSKAGGSQPTKGLAKRVEGPLPPVVAFPVNGTVVRATSQEGVAPFKIVTRDPDQLYVVKLVRFGATSPTLTIYVRGGTTSEITVPIGTYEMKYATGPMWYGDNYLFGDQTKYWKADQTFQFSQDQYFVHGMTVELFLQVDGNLKTDEIPAEEW